MGRQVVPPSEIALLCRDGGIRTHDPLHPMQVRYRTAPRPESLLIKEVKPNAVRLVVIPTLILSTTRRTRSYSRRHQECANGLDGT